LDYCNAKILLIVAFIEYFFFFICVLELHFSWWLALLGLERSWCVTGI